MFKLILAVTVGFAAALPCDIPAYGWKITAGSGVSECAAAGTQLAADATCTVVVAAGYTASGTGVNTCNNAQSALSATSDLAVTGCLANFYQSAGTSAADGVCTACVGGTLAAAAFGSSTTTCVATCTLPALGYKIVKGTCGAAGQTAAADSTCTVAADTGYASAGSADNVCAASSASFTPNALAVTGCLANFYQSAGTSAADGVCTACAGTTKLAAANFKGATTTCAAVACIIPAYGWKIDSGDCPNAGTQLAASASCTVVVDTGYTKKSGTDGVNTCDGLQTALTAKSDIAVSGCATDYYQSAGTSAADGVCTICAGTTKLAAANFKGATTTCDAAVVPGGAGKTADGSKTCAAGVIADTCDKDATLKELKTAAELCPACNELAAVPTVDTAAKACKACPVKKFPNVAGTTGCGGCANNCDECTAANVCTKAGVGFFLKAGVEKAVGVDACVAGADATCKPDAALKLVKTAAELCPAGNVLTATPAVDTAAKACKACGVGKTAKAKDTTGCADVAGKCAGNTATATDLATINKNDGAGNTYHFDCGCPLKMVLKKTASTDDLSGADAAAKKVVCCTAYVAPPAKAPTTPATPAKPEPVAPSPAGLSAGASATTMAVSTIALSAIAAIVAL